VTPEMSGSLIGQTLGGYRLTSLLGAGGMAEVYRAQELALDREVAVKVLPAALAADAGYVVRFRDEARRVAALAHPYIVPVYHYGEERGLLFLVMPVLRESLRERMQRQSPLPPTEAARYVTQIAAALDAAHAHGLVHRDVKPENILLSSESKALLTDFGIAREAAFLRQTGAARTLAATGLPVGTPEYMAPEQLRAANVDHRADIYALGAVLYELLTGTVPHDAGTPYEVAALVLTESITPPSARNPAIWPELERVVMKALEKDAEHRFGSARDFALALRAAMQVHAPGGERLTMPVSLRAEATVPALAALGVPLAVAPTTDESVPQESPPDDPDATGAVPAVWLTPPQKQTWRQFFRPRPVGSRRMLVLGAVVALALIGACGGTSLAILTGFSTPGTTGSFSFQPVGGTNTSGATASSGAPTGTGTAGATGTAPGTQGPTATLAPTSTPLPTASPSPISTATPVPALTFSPANIELAVSNNGHTCAGSQAIISTYSSSVSWFWSFKTKSMSFRIHRSDETSYVGNSQVRDPSMPAHVTDQLTFSFDCSTSAPGMTVKVTDSQGGTYIITLDWSTGG
jgi:serine/threonine protein kinase